MTNVSEIESEDLNLDIGDHFAEALNRLNLSHNQASHVFEVDNRTITRCAKGQKSPGPFLKTMVRAALRNYSPASMPYSLNGFDFADALHAHKINAATFAAMCGVGVDTVNRHLNRTDLIPSVMSTLVKWLDDGARIWQFAPKGIDLADRQKD